MVKSTNQNGSQHWKKWLVRYLDTEASHVSHRPIPTCLRNHAFINEVNSGKGPIHMVTMEAFQDPHLEEIGWHNFLGMTVGQAVLWAATDVNPKYENPELTTSSLM